ncbi:hypothetical protein ACV356_33345 [Pseudomonas aeruginosa]
MNTRKLGNSRLEIQAIVLGGNVLDWNAEESTSLRLLEVLIEAGVK